MSSYAAYARVVWQMFLLYKKNNSENLLHTDSFLNAFFATHIISFYTHLLLYKSTVAKFITVNTSHVTVTHNSLHFFNKLPHQKYTKL
jgi:hypothetical protein